MKKSTIIIITVCLIFVVYVIFDFSYGWHIDISSNIEIQIPLSAKLEKKDTHRRLSWRWRIFCKNIFYARTI